MEKLELTLLNHKQLDWSIYRNDEMLEVFQKYGINTTITDLALLTGACYDTSNKKEKRGRTWLKSSDSGKVVIISSHNAYELCPAPRRIFTIRPIFQSSSLFSEVSKNRVTNDEVEYGEYPQYVPCKYIQKELEKQYWQRKLQKTGRNYTFDKNAYDASKGFKAITYDEYEYKGRKYIRIKANTCYLGIERVQLSDGEYYKNGDYVWVEVSPVKWLIDDKTETFISKVGLLSGIRFDKNNYYNGNFEATEMYRYLNTHMVRDLFQTTKLITPEIPKKTVKLSEQEKLINEIKNYLEKIKNNEQFVNEVITIVNNLIIEYNKSIQNVDVNAKLVLHNETTEGIKDIFTRKLEVILKKLKKIEKETTKYYEYIDFIDTLLNILDKKEVVINTDIKKDFQTLINVILPYLDKKDQTIILGKIKTMLEKEKNRLIDYIKYLSDMEILDKKEYDYDSLQNLELEIRKQIHPILEEIKEKVEKRNIYLEITKGIQEIIQNIYQKEQDSIISFYLILIDELFQKANENKYLTEEEKQQLYKIIKIPINFNVDINEVINQLIEIIKKLYSLNFSLQRKENEQQIKEKCLVKITIKN